MEHAFSWAPHLVVVWPSLWHSSLGATPKSGRLVEHWVDDRPDSATTRSDLGQLLSIRCTLDTLFECECHSKLSKSRQALWTRSIFNSTNTAGLFFKCDLSTSMFAQHAQIGGKGLVVESKFCLIHRGIAGGGQGAWAPSQKPSPPPLEPLKWNETLYRSLWRAAILSFLLPPHLDPVNPWWSESWVLIWRKVVPVSKFYTTV